jgi:hypothetical protein
LNARNWRYDLDGKTFRYGRIIVKPAPLKGRPNHHLVFVAPTEDSNDPDEWIALEAPELAAGALFAGRIQRDEFTEDERYGVDIIAEVEEAAEKPNFVAMALHLDLYAARWAVLLNDLRRRGVDDGWTF